MRQPIGLQDKVKDIVVKMSEGNPGAINVLMNLLQYDMGFMHLLNLDDMNIWGTQIWVGFKEHCDGDLDKFVECIKSRDKAFVDTINKVGARGNHDEIAVCSGGSRR